MTTYKRGDVVLVPFPFSNQTATKKRPAVVISSSLYNGKTNDVIIDEQNRKMLRRMLVTADKIR